MASDEGHPLPKVTSKGSTGSSNHEEPVETHYKTKNPESDSAERPT